jgi:hypothetical protein
MWNHPSGGGASSLRAICESMGGSWQNPRGSQGRMRVTHIGIFLKVDESFFGKHAARRDAAGKSPARRERRPRFLGPCGQPQRDEIRNARPAEGQLEGSQRCREGKVRQTHRRRRTKHRQTGRGNDRQVSTKDGANHPRYDARMSHERITTLHLSRRRERSQTSPGELRPRRGHGNSAHAARPTPPDYSPRRSRLTSYSA